MWIYQPDLCYWLPLHLLSEVTVSDLWMCHVGVVGHRIHPTLCTVTEETHSATSLRRGVGGKGAFTSIREDRGAGVMWRIERQGDGRYAAAHAHSHVHATRVGVH